MTNYSLNAIPDTWTHYEHPWYTQLDLLGNTTTLESQSQQKHKSETTGQKSTRQCSLCKQTKPLSEFHYRISGGDRDDTGKGRDHRCRDCLKKYKKSLHQAKKNAPPKSASCQCCGREDRSLVLDHIFNTPIVRGWLCKSCNTGIGLLGDNLEGLTNAVNYLSTTNGSQIENSTRAA